MILNLNVQSLLCLAAILPSCVLGISILTKSSTNLQCFTCRNARSNEECNRNLVTCQASQQSCQTEIRVWNTDHKLQIIINKGCKQTHACMNNEKQNYMQAWPITQCNTIANSPLSVCRHCCSTPGCNGDMEQRTCSPLSAPRNGKMFCSYNNDVKSNVCSFECDKCYKLKGTDRRMCMDERVWSGEEARCVYDESCDACDVKMTQPPRSGSSACTNFNRLSSVCSFVCDEGYDLFGTGVVTCDASSKIWSFPKPRCLLAEKTQVVNCRPFSVENGQVDCTSGTELDSTCTVVCDPGYEANGGSKATCAGEIPDWDNNPQCKLMLCDQLPAEVLNLVNGAGSCTDGNRVGSICSFSCDKSFTLQGNDVIICDFITKEWIGELPFCKQDCHEFALESPDQQTCDCLRGFEGNGFDLCEDINECLFPMLSECHEMATCENTIGSFTCTCIPGYRGDGFSCVDIDECLELLDDCMSSEEGGICVNTPGSFECTCAPEYIGDGRNCTKLDLPCPPHELLQGEYCFKYLVVDPEHPSYTASDACANIESGHPASIKTKEEYDTLNAILLNKLVPLNDLTTVILGPWIGLDDRYEPGKLRWRDGAPLLPRDYQMWAPKQPSIRGGTGARCVHLVSDPVKFNTRDFLWVDLYCNEFARYVCDSEKTNEQITLCQPALAGMPNGNVECTDGWRNGSTCTFTCKPGFTLIGPSASVTCVAPYMAWDNILPVCVESVCPPVVAPNAGSVMCSDGHKTGSVCQYSCNDGYLLQGTSQVICQPDLDWSGRKPCCLDECPPKARLNLVFVVDRSSSIGEVNFQTIINFTKSMYSAFEISAKFTQVSLVGFDSVVYVPSGRFWHANKSEVDDAISQLNYSGKGTLAGQALNFVATNLMGARPGIQKVVIVLTDGNAKDDLVNNAKILRDSDAHVIAIGITGSHLQDLSVIASKPIKDNIYSLAEVSDINEIVTNVADQVCSVQC